MTAICPGLNVFIVLPTVLLQQLLFDKGSPATLGRQKRHTCENVYLTFHINAQQWILKEDILSKIYWCTANGISMDLSCVVVFYIIEFYGKVIWENIIT